MDSIELSLDTGDRLLTDLTGAVEDFCRGRGDGLLHVFAPHATAGLILIELGAGSDPDFADLVDRLLPPDARYRHRHGSPGHGRDHQPVAEELEVQWFKDVHGAPVHRERPRAAA
jgi:thiamine phosphate synthase YjbQ (UPF0047 family)